MAGRDLVAFTSKISEVTTDHDKKNTASLTNTDILQQLETENPRYRYMNDHALIDYTMLITGLYECMLTFNTALGDLSQPDTQQPPPRVRLAGMPWSCPCPLYFPLRSMKLKGGGRVGVWVPLGWPWPC